MPICSAPFEERTIRVFLPAEIGASTSAVASWELSSFWKAIRSSTQISSLIGDWRSDSLVRSIRARSLLIPSGARKTNSPGLGNKRSSPPDGLDNQRGREIWEIAASSSPKRVRGFAFASRVSEEDTQASLPAPQSIASSQSFGTTD